MATLNVAFPFASTAEGFTGTGYSGATLTYDGSGGNPAGSLETDVQGRNKAGISYWEWSGTWEDLGVTAGDDVSQVRLTGHDSQCSAFNVVDAATVGIIEIRDSIGDTVIATLYSGRTVSGTEGSWTDPGAQSYQAIGSTYQASTTTIRIRINADIDLGNNANAAFTFAEDNFELDVDHAGTGNPPLTGDKVTAGIPTVEDPTIAQTFVLTGDDVTAGIPTVSDPTIQNWQNLVAKTYKNTGGLSGPTAFASIDTTGANLLIVAVSYYADGTLPTVSDNYTNTWNALTEYDNVGNNTVMLFYAYDATVGTNHIVTVTHPSTPYGSIFLYAFSGMDDTSGVFDDENGLGVTDGSYSTGYITPAESGELIISVFCLHAEEVTPPTVSSPFSVEDYDFYEGSITNGGAVGFVPVYDSTSQIQATWTGGGGDASTIAAFKFASGNTLTGDDVTAGIPTVEDPTIGQTFILTGDDVTAGIPTVEDPTIAQTFVLTGDDVTAGIPTVEDPILYWNHLAGEDVIFGIPTVEDPTISQTFVLTGDDVTAGVPTVEDPDLGQIWELIGDDVTAGVPTVEDPTISQTFILTGDDVIAGIPTVSDPVISQEVTYDLIGDDVIAGVPTVEDPTISQTFVLTGDDVTAGVPTVEDPTITQSFVLTGDNVIFGIPTVEDPTIAQTFVLTGDDVIAGIPTISDPDVGQIWQLTGDDVVAGIPTVEDATISQTFVLTGDDVTAGIPSVSDPFISQEVTYDLTGDDVVAGIPTVEDPTISQTFILTGDDVTAGVPTVEDPTISQTFILTGDDVTAGIPTISDPDLGQIWNLIGDNVTGGIPTISDPLISQLFVLVGEDVISGIPTISDPILRVTVPITPDYRRYLVEVEDRRVDILLEDRTLIIKAGD